ncbi:MAG TPA: phosphatidate cytidylyltransferase [Desulfuromonas sp.]|nr:phosphatidate cytidylyltransferase [Desulfuromonas sp.]
MKQRIITALIALPLLILFLINAGPVTFAGLVVVVATLALGEFYSMFLPTERRGERLLAMAAGAGLTVLLCWQRPHLFEAGLTAAVLVFALLFLFRYRDLATVTTHLAAVCLGFLYLPLLLGHLALLRFLPFGRQWIFLVLVIVMVGDSVAYFVGSAFGRRRLYPAISPKKSIEGALGGLLGSTLGALLCQVIFFPQLTVVDCLLLGAGLGLLGQVGDLFESMLKRATGVKDSGTMIPGHGGLLDRLDSLLFTFAPAYYYAIWVF